MARGNRRTWPPLGATIACAGALGVAACGGGSSGGDAAKVAAVGKVTGAAADAVAPWAASGKIDKTTINVCFFSGPEFDAMKQRGPQFTAYTKGKVTVKFTEIPTAQWLPQTLTQLRSGSSNCDVVDDSSSGATTFEPYMQPLEPLMKDSGLFNAKAYNLADFPESVRSQVTSKDKGLLALPMASDTQLLFYRKDLLKKWGIAPPPATGWNWDQFYGVMRKIQAGIKQDGMDGVYPVTFSGTPNTDGAISALMGIWSTGGEPFKDGKPNFLDPKSLAGFNRFAGLKSQLNAVSPAIGSYAYAEVLTALQKGKAVTAMQWNASSPPLEDPKQSPLTAGKLGYTVTPYDASAGAEQQRAYPSIHAFGINKASKHVREAFEYAVWYTSKSEAMDFVGAGQGSSGRASVLSAPSIVNHQPQMRALGQSLKLMHALPDVPSSAELLSNVVGADFNAVLTGAKPPAKAAKDIQSGAESALQKAGG